jgi:hypothetical protein
MMEMESQYVPRVFGMCCPGRKSVGGGREKGGKRTRKLPVLV